MGKAAAQEEEAACAKAQRKDSQRVRKEARRVGGRGGGREGREYSHQQGSHIIKGLAYLRTPSVLVNFGEREKRIVKEYEEKRYWRNIRKTE